MKGGVIRRRRAKASVFDADKGYPTRSAEVVGKWLPDVAKQRLRRALSGLDSEISNSTRRSLRDDHRLSSMMSSFDS
jgi:hypothetical protein